MHITKATDLRNSDPETCETNRGGSLNRLTRYRYKSSQIRPNVPNKNSLRRNVLSFLHFLDSCPGIKEFLNYDSCFRLADKYLIAMVFIYFERAGIQPENYTRLKFFAALCLAHSMEEENKELLGEILPWALGISHLIELAPFLIHAKLSLWKAIDYRAFVNKYCCQKVMSVCSHHSVWKRNRTSINGENQMNYFRKAQSARKY